tara:strand:- start:101 stop:1387 length:1287 start_codon:yes stop_codon:yes gene_type:complete
MNNILVFPCSTGLSIEIYHSLKNVKNINLYGLNLNKKSRGYYLYTNYEEFISYNDEKFKDKLKIFIDNNNINTIIPGDDNSVYILKELETYLNVKVITSCIETSKIARSKKKTYDILRKHISVPEIFNINDNILYPVFIKPDEGAGAVDSYMINNSIELHKKMTQNHIICEHLPGKEYTIECLTDKNRKLLCSITRERTIVSNGLSIGTEIIKNDKLNIYINKIASKINDVLEFKGSWFFQVKYNKNNELTLLEISTRLPGASNIVRNYGINMTLLSLFIHQNKDVEIEKLPIENINTMKIYQNYYDIEFDDIENLYLDFDDTIIINNKVNIDVISIIYKFVNKNKSVYLITRHIGNLFKTLELYKINKNLFTDIYWIKDNTSKNNYIKDKSFFIDDSFQERKSIDKHRNIYCFDVSSLDILVNNKNV